jgi:hypothetical protein
MFNKRKPDIDVQKDGRVILRGVAYRKMRLKLKGLAKGMCEECGSALRKRRRASSEWAWRRSARRSHICGRNSESLLLVPRMSLRASRTGEGRTRQTHRARI